MQEQDTIKAQRSKHKGQSTKHTASFRSGSQIAIVHVSLIVDTEDLRGDEIASRGILRIQWLTSHRCHFQLH